MKFEDVKKGNVAESMESKVVERERAIRQFLAESLPPTEERIREPMNPRCEVCVVLPAYNEREYILRPLVSLAKQEGVNPDQYEVIIVVNNPPNIPKISEDETKDEYINRVKLYNDAVENNQETLKLVRYINGEDITIILTEQEQEIITAIQQSGLRVFVIDKASENKTLSQEVANVGGARNRGIAEAIERFHEHVRKNGILVHSDAEVRFSDKYIQDIIRIFKEDPELIGITNSVDHEPAEEMDELFRIISVYTQMQEEYEELSHLLHKSNTETFARTVDFDGSNMASRAFETAMAGGIPKVSGAEDTYFGWRLAEIGKVKEGHEPITTTIDRFSSRTTTGRGLKTMRYQDMIKESGTIYVKSPEIGNVRQRIKDELLRAIASRQIEADHLKKVFQVGGHSMLSEEELDLLSDAFKRMPREDPTKILSTLVAGRDPKISHFFNTAGLNLRIESLEPNVPIDIAAPKLIEILSANSEIQKRYISIREAKILEENREISNRNRILESLCDIVFSKSDRAVPNQSLANVIRHHKDELGLSDQQLRSLDVKSSALSVLSEILLSSGTRQEALERAREAFRYILSPLEPNSPYFKTLELSAMRDAVENYKLSEKR